MNIVSLFSGYLEYCVLSGIKLRVYFHSHCRSWLESPSIKSEVMNVQPWTRSAFIMTPCCQTSTCLCPTRATSWFASTVLASLVCKSPPFISHPAGRASSKQIRFSFINGTFTLKLHTGTTADTRTSHLSLLLVSAELWAFVQQLFKTNALIHRTDVRLFK